jgi:type IV pilus assembly protein PilW
MMVTMLLSSALILLVSNLYISIFSSQRNQYEKAAMYENASTALTLLGRNIELAGYYPTNYAVERTGNLNVAGQYSNSNTLQYTQVNNSPTYKYPLMGCTAKYWDRVKDACINFVNNEDSDSIVINYYTDDDSTNIGMNIDKGIATNCLRNGTNNVLNPNKTKVFLISNRYSLSTTLKAYAENKAIVISNLSCDVDKSINAGTTSGYQALVEGIDQLRFTYLESIGLNTRYVTANNVSDWSNVVAVKICIVARSLLQTGGVESTYTIKDCDNASVSYSDGISREKFSQIFSAKNNQGNMRLPQ